MTSRRDRWLLFAAVAAVSTAAVFIRGAGEAPPIVIATYRLVFGATLFVVPALFARGAAPAMDRRTRAVAVLAGVFLAAHFATWIASLRHTSVASSLALVTAHPLIVAIGSRVLFGERVTRRVGVGIAIGLVGIVTVALVDGREGGTSVLPVGANAVLGDLLAFAGCVFVAGYFFCGRWARERVSLLPYVATAYGAAAITLLVTSFVTHQRLFGFAPQTYLFFVLLALIPQGIGHTLVNRSLRAFPAPVVSLAILGEVPLSTALAWAFLGEAVPFPRLLAVSVVVLAVGVAVADPSRVRRQAAPVG